MGFLLILLLTALLIGVILYLKLKETNKRLENELALTVQEFDKKSNLFISEKEVSAKTHAAEISKHLTRIEVLEKKYAPLLALDNEITNREINIQQLKETFEKLNEKYQDSLLIHQALEAENDLYTETLEINAYGLYKPKYSFDLPEQYVVELEGIYNNQKLMIKNHTAAICHTEWSVGGSKSEGKKMTNQELKLMLLAFNGECDSVIARAKWNNIGKSKEKIFKAFMDINKLGTVSHSEITRPYLDLKFEELALAYEYEVKKHEQKEEQRLIREQMREEEKVQRESERIQQEADEEAKLYKKVLEKARLELGVATKEEANALMEKISVLEEKLKAAQDRKERAISQAQQTKVGNIYIISNIGSFGENIFKIGMTRRFDPMERVRELSDAALPFQFDVHAIIHSENAPQFERDLHNKFTNNRINRVNNRKEFFNITLDEIESFVKQETNAEIQFTKMAEAREYRQTLSLIEQLNLKSGTEAEKQPSKFPTSLL